MLYTPLTDGVLSHRGCASDDLVCYTHSIFTAFLGTTRILEYTPETDTWVELPTPTEFHGMVSLNGKLTLVGGCNGKESTTALRVIRVWDSDSKQWTEPYPPMTMGRKWPGCASYQHYLIIAGGDVEGKL